MVAASTPFPGIGDAAQRGIERGWLNRTGGGGERQILEKGARLPG
jgi:hypothetical protein